jgi:hypothetical protein
MASSTDSLTDDLRRDIEQIEARIEGLRDKIQSCRAAIKLAKLAGLGGALCFAAILIGAISADATILVFSIAAMVAGFVWRGANQSSLRVALEELHADERMRADLIDQIPFADYPPLGDNATQADGPANLNQGIGSPDPQDP